MTTHPAIPIRAEQTGQPGRPIVRVFTFEEPACGEPIEQVGHRRLRQLQDLLEILHAEGLGVSAMAVEIRAPAPPLPGRRQGVLYTLICHRVAAPDNGDIRIENVNSHTASVRR